MKMKKITKVLSGVISVAILAAGGTIAASATINFSDVHTEGWAYPYISNLTGNGVITGYEDGTFRPDQKVTKAEYLALVMRAAAYETQEDANAAHWWTPYFEKAVDRGLIIAEEYETTIDSPISRYAMAELVANVLKDKEIDVAAETNVLSDVSAHQDAVGICYSAGIITGYEDGTFSGNEAMERDTTAASVCRLIDVLEGRKTSLPPTEADIETMNPDTTDTDLEPFVIDGSDDMWVHFTGTVYARGMDGTSEPAANAMLEFFEETTLGRIPIEPENMIARCYAAEDGTYEVWLPMDSNYILTTAKYPVRVHYEDEDGNIYSNTYKINSVTEECAAQTGEAAGDLVATAAYVATEPQKYADVVARKNGWDRSQFPKLIRMPEGIPNDSSDLAENFIDDIECTVDGYIFSNNDPAITYIYQHDA